MGARDGHNDPKPIPPMPIQFSMIEPPFRSKIAREITPISFNNKNNSRLTFLLHYGLIRPNCGERGSRLIRENSGSLAPSGPANGRPLLFPIMFPIRPLRARTRRGRRPCSSSSRARIVRPEKVTAVQ